VKLNTIELTQNVSLRQDFGDHSLSLIDLLSSQSKPEPQPSRCPKQIQYKERPLKCAVKVFSKCHLFHANIYRPMRISIQSLNLL